MAKRFTSTDKYRSPFIRGLQGAYKVLWDYLQHECDHAGIWLVDFEIAQICVGRDLPIDKATALEQFNEEEERVVVLQGGKKWLILDFIREQYGHLNETNRVHKSVIDTLAKNGIRVIDGEIETSTNKPLTSPLQGAKDKDMDKEKEKEEEGVQGETDHTIVKPGPDGTDETERLFIHIQDVWPKKDGIKGLTWNVTLRRLREVMRKQKITVVQMRDAVDAQVAYFKANNRPMDKTKPFLSWLNENLWHPDIIASLKEETAKITGTGVVIPGKWPDRFDLELWRGMPPNSESRAEYAMHLRSLGYLPVKERDGTIISWSAHATSPGAAFEPVKNAIGKTTEWQRKTI